MNINLFYFIYLKTNYFPNLKIFNFILEKDWYICYNEDTKKRGGLNVCKYNS